MKITFNVEEYEDMINSPFSADDYFQDRITIYILENKSKLEILTSTFHDAILLEIGDGLIKMYEGTNSSFHFEVYENPNEYTYKEFQKLLTIIKFNDFDGKEEELLKCHISDFTIAFVNEYEKYHKNILANDKNAFKNEIFVLMSEQINTLNNILKGII